MATVSGFGFSGVDHLNTLFEQQVNGMNSFAWNGKDMRRNMRYQKRMMRFQQDMNRQNALWNAHNMPKAQVAGYRAAGINPIAAYGSLGNVGAGDASMSNIASGPSAHEVTFGDTGFDAQAFHSAKGARRVQQQVVEQNDSNIAKTKAETDAVTKQADAAKVQAEASLLNAQVNSSKQTSEITRNYVTSAGSGLGSVASVVGAIGAALSLRRLGGVRNILNTLLKKGVPLNLHAAKPAAPGFIVPPYISKTPPVATPPIDKLGPVTVGNSAKNVSPLVVTSSGFVVPALLASMAGLGYLGSQYGIGKYIEKNMTEDEKKAFDKIKPVRYYHESPVLWKNYKR